MRTKKGKFDELLAAEVAGGTTIRKAAEKHGCSYTHAYHLSCDPAFQKRVSAIRSEAVAAAVGRLSTAAQFAVGTLVALLHESNDARDRLNAAKAILAALGPISELGELRARIEKMENEQLRVAG